MTHPAVTMDFNILQAGLEASVESGHTRKTTDDTGLELYCYTEACTYDRQWNDFTLLARGLILFPAEKKVVGMPFPKFFNLGEHQIQNVPDLPFETYEKLDGSLIILFHHKGQWRTATKGSLKSDQALWATMEIQKHKLDALVPGTTYLLEAIYHANKIVVSYSYEGLSLLGAYTEQGGELTYSELQQTAETSGFRVAKSYAYQSVSDLVARAAVLPSSEEGFVLRFSNGLRLKIKGDEYCRIHALISRLTPLAMWEAMMAGDDLEKIRRDLPEEFLQDFDNIIMVLNQKVNALISKVTQMYRHVANMSDKEVGLQLSSFPDDVRSFIFPYRRNKGDLLSGKARQAVFKQIRPNGNILPGYVPSYAINKVLEEVA